LKQPPLHARKSFIFKVNETDYFGAYTKKKELLVHHVGESNNTVERTTSHIVESKVKPQNELSSLPPTENCIVVLS
jgi:hypothetical protein